MVDSDNTNIRFNPKGEGVPRRTGDERKAHPPGRDFKKVLSKEKDSQHQGEKKKKGVGDEDLGQIADATKQPQDKVARKRENISLFDLSADAAAKEKEPKQVAQADEAKVSTLFAQEQPDRAGVNPAAAPVSSLFEISSTQAAEKPAPIAPRIQEIVEQLVARLQVAETAGQTDTTVVLKHPPLLRGANVVITEFDTAKGEFNIKFENLTQAAKELLDIRENQENLRLALDQKGYKVHIMVTTTEKETPLVAETEQAHEGKGARGEEEQAEKEKDEEERQER